MYPSTLPETIHNYRIDAVQLTEVVPVVTLWRPLPEILPLSLRIGCTNEVMGFSYP